MPALQLEQTADAMVSAAAEGRSVVAALKKHSPQIYRQISRDAPHSELLAAWGKSRNCDDIVGATIVPPAIVDVVGSLAGVAMRGRNVHAGLLHTYGYLFSSIVTPYGFKRDRWISNDLERGFGLDARVLSDQPRQGTLLANATWFFGRFAFRDRPELLRRFDESKLHVARELIRYDYAQHEVHRIVEQAEPSGTLKRPGLKRPVTFVTDLIPYPNPPADPHAENTLLVYSLQIGRTAPRKLITGFPIRAEMMRTLLASALQQEGTLAALTAVGPQYNAYVPGFPSRTTIAGRRALVE